MGPQHPLDFRIQWPAEATRPEAPVQGPLFLVTSAAGLAEAQVESVIAGCKPARPLVVVAPGLTAAALSRLATHGALALKATALEGQPLDELLEDFAIATRSRALIGVFCPEAGDSRPRPGESPGGIVLPGFGWADVKPQELGSAESLSFDGDGVSVRCRADTAVEGRIRFLKAEIERAEPEQEREGLRRRLARFGGESTPGRDAASAVCPPAAAGDLVVPAGYASRFFVTDADTWEAVLEKARVLLAAVPLTEVDHVVPVLELASAHTFPLFVAAPKVEGAALATMAINKLRGIVRCLAVSLGPESSARGHLSELARLTGARILGSAGALQTPSLDSLGKVSRVAATTKRTIVQARRAAG